MFSFELAITSAICLCSWILLNGVKGKMWAGSVKRLFNYHIMITKQTVIVTPRIQLKFKI